MSDEGNMFFRHFVLLFVVVALVACNNEKNRNLIDRRADQVIRIGQDAQKPAPKKSYDPLTVSDKIWSGNSSMRMRRGLPLPSKFESEHGITLISNEPVSLSEIATAISTQTGVPIRLADGMSGGLSAGDTGTVAMEGKMPIAYEGSFSGLLDLICSNFSINWHYDGSAIKLSRFETRVFVVDALPGTQSIKDGIKEETNSGGNSSSTASAGGSFSMSSGNALQQSSEMNVELKVWEELNQTISSILGGVGSVVLSPSSGTAAVTTTPDIMQTVARFIEEENKRLTQQIAINVEIYAVALAEDTDFNLSFDTAFKKLSNFDANISTGVGPAASTTGLGSLSVAILNPKTVGQVTTVFSALSTIGDTTRVSQFPLTTLNNRTVSRRVGRDVTYVASLSNTESTSTTGYSSSTVTPGTIREGFSLQLTPRLLTDGRIMLQYSLSLVDIVKTRQLDTGAGIVELPETSSRVFVQQAMLKSGSTLVIGGYDDEKTEQSSNGVGNAYNYFMGGGSVNSKARAMMFIVITPQVLDVPKTERE
ncbi:MAG: secretin N-terminal domain-containing protein [Alphaproteobacteria bacterium]|nr:secretin N-terminal domain-containing protein [Alphaproteobacteria bacterium]